MPSEDYFSKEVFSKELRTYRIVERGSIAYNPSRINVGSIALQDKEDKVIVSPLYVVFSVDGQCALPEYVVRFLKSKPGLDQIAGQSIGTVRSNLKLDALCRLELRLPSLAEQEQMLAILRSIEREIEGAQRILKKLDSLAKSRFVEMFGDPVDGALWPRKQLRDIYHVKSSKRIYANEQVKSGVPFYRLADIGTLIDGATPKSGLYISEGKFEELKARGQVPRPDDILVTARGTLGRCYVIKGGDRFYFQDGMITWLGQTDATPLPTYLLSVFSNGHFSEWLNANCSGTTVRYLSINDLGKASIPVPPLETQREFAAFAAQVDKSESIARKQIEKLQMLYDSLAQEYFG